jgi:hypothetical protein
MSLQDPRSRIYRILFVTVLLIVFAYAVAGTAGIVIGLVFGGLFAVVAGIVNRFENLSPTLRLFIIALTMIVIIIVLSAIILVILAQNGPWLPVAD